MEANELRIGNYVNVPREDQSPFKIDGFDFLNSDGGKIESEVKIDGKKLHPLTWYLSDLSPIELTEEWLLKMEFSWKNIPERYMLGSWSTLRVCRDLTIEYKDSYLVNVKFVHQLQNLYFALTGEELTIKTNNNGE
jgi:hypothetical protein